MPEVTEKTKKAPESAAPPSAKSAITATRVAKRLQRIRAF